MVLVLPEAVGPRRCSSTKNSPVCTCVISVNPRVWVPGSAPIRYSIIYPGYMRGAKSPTMRERGVGGVIVSRLWGEAKNSQIFAGHR